MELSNEVLRGKENHLFLNQGQHSVADYFTGKKDIAEISKRNFFVNIKRRQTFCDRKGIKYLNVVFPDKIYINQKYHDLNVKSLYKNRFMTSRYFREDINNIYIGDFLLGIDDAFFKTDTHLSLNGNIKTVQAILMEYFQDIFSQYTKYINKGSYTNDNFVGDLGGKFNPPISESTRVYKLDKNIELVDNGMVGGNDGIIVLCENKNSVSTQTLLIFGDSFFHSLLPHLAFFYKKIIFCRTRYFHYELIDSIRPDVVFTGMAERYLNKVSLDDERYDFFMYPYINNKSINPSEEFSILFNKFIKRDNQ